MSSPGISTYGFRDEVFGVRRLDEMHAAGFKHIELLANRPHLDYHDRRLHLELADWAISNPTATLSLHLPFLEQTGRSSLRWISGLAPDEGDREVARDEIKRALELTHKLQIGWVVLHLGTPGQRFSSVHFEYAYALVEIIRSYSAADILIETLPNEIAQPGRIIEFLRTADLPEIRICYDIGHCHLEGLPGEFERIGAVHLSDNDGTGDQHLWPFDGTIDWARVAATMAESRFDGPLIVEGPDPHLGKAIESTERFRELLLEARNGSTNRHPATRTREGIDSGQL